MTLQRYCILLIGIICTANTVHAQVTFNVLDRVFMIRYKSQSGTAFTLDVDNRQYLITAKHVVPGIKSTDEISFFHDKKWKKLQVRTIQLKPAAVDIIVLIPPRQLSPAYELEATKGGFMLAQQFYFLGFPYMMHTDVGDFNRGFPMPFVKGGILSAFDNRKDKGYSLLYIDGMNNPGFSGGPVVYKDHKSNNFKVAGVVSSYKNHPDVVVNQNLNTGLKAISNSGIMIAHGIYPAIEAIKLHPDGPLIKQEKATKNAKEK